MRLRTPLGEGLASQLLALQLELSALSGLASAAKSPHSSPALLEALTFNDGSRQVYKDPGSYFRPKLPHGKAFNLHLLCQCFLPNSFPKG